ncbi:MAG: bifunctional folylpolyglutamate synthase/dihydrofolate synthase [Flavobacteriales bacterium]|nr:bifunctional folylpolyglutamate synthase/dihydrofolate synthase [Flavobacteriales bacterium]
MDYLSTINYLYKQLPVFQRVGAPAYKADLSNTAELCNLLDNPQQTFKSIHIAGTNGKGSTSHMLASILQEAGYKVGLYTSPHLIDFRERIKINGKMIGKREVINFTQQYKSEFEKIQLSFFEWTVGLAFNYFSKNKVDIAVIETGLGGRLDSTNIISPIVSVITNISKDHTQFLGDTLEKIAVEKAGIIKSQIPVVIGETQPETKFVFIETAKKKNSPISFADQVVKVSYKSDLIGIYQEKNKKTVIETINKIKENGFSVDEKCIQNGLSRVIKNTGLMGRWQKLQENPLTICDTGHNESGINEVLKQIEQTKYKKLHFVFGAVNDKDIDAVLAMLPKSANYYFCQAKIPRALDVNILYEQSGLFGLKGNKFSSVESALMAAKKVAKKEDLVFIGGSTFVVAEALELYYKKKKEK